MQGYSLPQQRYTAEEYGRKFGNEPIDEIMSNEIEGSSPSAKEEKSLLTTVLELAMQFVPTLIDTLSGGNGKSDGIEGLDGEDPFSMKNIMILGLKLFLAVAGGSGDIEKSDNSSPIQPIMGVLIGAVTGSDDSEEVAVMAKQATEVVNLLITLVEALATSISQRGFY